MEDLRKEFREDRSSGSRDMLADTQLDMETDRAYSHRDAYRQTN